MSLTTDTIYRNTFKSKCYTLQRYRRSSSYKVTMQKKSYITFVIDPPLMMAQSRAESTWDTNNYGKNINQFPPNTIKSIRQYERINKKIYRQKISIMFNEICINEEMLPKYTHTHTHTHTYIYIYIYIREGEWKSNAFFFSTRVIIDTGTRVMYPNEAGHLLVTSQQNHSFSQKQCSTFE